jgi:hypothetical protein
VDSAPVARPGPPWLATGPYLLRVDCSSQVISRLVNCPKVEPLPDALGELGNGSSPTALLLGDCRSVQSSFDSAVYWLPTPCPYGVEETIGAPSPLVGTHAVRRVRWVLAKMSLRSSCVCRTRSVFVELGVRQLSPPSVYFVRSLTRRETLGLPFRTVVHKKKKKCGFP